MNAVILDIETVATTDERLIACVAARAKNDEERAEAIERLALSPFTGRVCCIGMMNLATGGTKTLAYADERATLMEACDVLARFDRVVTFNGRGFDVPFMNIRAAIHGVPTRRDLMGNRYRYHPHCDLMEMLTFYGAARGRPSLELACLAFGIDNPKGGICGADVGRLFDEGRFEDIAAYCLGDVRATAGLYKMWDERLRAS